MTIAHTGQVRIIQDRIHREQADNLQRILDNAARGTHPGPLKPPPPPVPFVPHPMHRDHVRAYYLFRELGNGPTAADALADEVMTIPDPQRQRRIEDLEQLALNRRIERSDTFEREGEGFRDAE